MSSTENPIVSKQIYSTKEYLFTSFIIFTQLKSEFTWLLHLRKNCCRKNL